MRKRSLIGLAALAAALGATFGSGWITSALAFDESKYPDLKGQWQRTEAPRWGKPSEAPLTPEYRAIFEANLKEQAQGGQGTDPTFTCLAPGLVQTQMLDYVCSLNVDERYPAVGRIRNAIGTDRLQTPSQAAARLLDVFPRLLERPSGSYVDIRET